MKITYTPNPLMTIVQPTELEIEQMRYKILYEDMMDMLFTVHYELGRENPDMDRIKSTVHPDYYLNEEDGKTKQEEHVQELLEYYIQELQGTHDGDCTCVPCSCSKCYAEGLLNIDTIKGLGKNEAHKVKAAFSRYNPETKQHDLPEVSLDDALEKLRTYKPKADWVGYESYIPRWTEEAKRAYEWLLAYKQEHFSKDQS